MRKYELMFIVRPDLEKENLKTVSEDIINLFDKNKVNLIEKKELGQKELAYPIKGHKTGYYFLYQFTIENTKTMAEIDHRLRLNEKIIRYLVTNIEE